MVEFTITIDQSQSLKSSQDVVDDLRGFAPSGDWCRLKAVTADFFLSGSAHEIARIAIQRFSPGPKQTLIYDLLICPPLLDMHSSLKDQAKV